MTTQTPHAVERGDVLSVSQLALSDSDALEFYRLSSIFPFGGRALPDSELGPHSAFLGQTGSGKTLGLLMMLRHVVGPVLWKGRYLSRVRSLVMDEQAEAVYPFVKHWLGEGWILESHPFAQSGVSLHLGKSCVSLEDGWELANVLIPETKRSHDFFDPAAQQVLQSAIHALQLLSQEWTLSDVVIACSDPQLLRHVIEHHPRSQAIIDRYLPAKVDASTNILQTVAVKMGKWTNVALLDRHAGEYFTIDGWIDSGAALVLRGSSRYPELSKRWNAFVFKLVLARLRNRPTSRPLDESFLFVDEMPESVIEDYRSAVLLGRSKGVRTVVSTQDPAAFVTRLGGKDAANEVLGQIANICVGRMTSPDSAEWMSRFFGKYQYWQERKSYSHSGGQWNESVHYDLREEYNVYPYDFQGFPKASLSRGFEVVARTPTIPGWRTHVSPAHIAEMLGDLPLEPEPRALRALLKEDIAFAWGPEDLKRLGLRPISPRKRKKPGLKLPR